jgi:cyclophilin family peptidyl-prolyl cis-trans isomerase
MAYRGGIRGLRRRWVAGASAALALGLISGCGSTPHAAPPKPKHWSKPPAMAINPNAKYTAIVKTSLGTFDIKLFAKEDPVAVNNFVFLARQGFYDNLRIFRIVPSFVFQTGDPKNDGQGGPGYYVKDELPPTVPYGPGVVAYANNGPNHNGSQFFVCTGSASASLSSDPAFTEIGQVTTSTMPVVEKIGSVKVKYNPAFQETSMPVHPVTMISVTIRESS